jgi:hypothetical protein
MIVIAWATTPPPRPNSERTVVLGTAALPELPRAPASVSANSFRAANRAVQRRSHPRSSRMMFKNRLPSTHKRRATNPGPSPPGRHRDHGGASEREF